MSDYRMSDSVMERRRARDKRDGLKHSTHVSGRCGMDVGACCHECHADQYAEMLEWSRARPDPLQGETAGAYWQRIGGAFLDSWHDVAMERMRLR